MPLEGDVGIRLLILSGEVFDSGKKHLRFRAKLERCLSVRGVFMGFVGRARIVGR